MKTWDEIKEVLDESDWLLDGEDYIEIRESVKKLELDERRKMDRDLSTLLFKPILLEILLEKQSISSTSDYDIKKILDVKRKEILDQEQKEYKKMRLKSLVLEDEVSE